MISLHKRTTLHRVTANDERVHEELELPILLPVTLTRLLCSLLRLFCCLLHLLESLPREGLRHPERFLIGSQRRAQDIERSLHWCTRQGLEGFLLLPDL